MKTFQIILLLALSSITQCFSVSASPLISAINKQDSQAIIFFFDEIEKLTLKEAYELIFEIYDYYTNQFGLDILESEEYLKNLENCKTLYHAILQRYGIPIKEGLILKQGNESFASFLSQKNSQGLNSELPDSIILGGVEVLGGALIWILPLPGAKQLGGILVGDGIRRTFNGLEEASNNNKRASNNH